MPGGSSTSRSPCPRRPESRPRRPRSSERRTCARYAERMYDALKIEVSEVDFLADGDTGFYSSSYLRAWAFESLLRSFLREEFGRAWFTRREAGSLLRELWAEGQKTTADALLA